MRARGAQTPPPLQVDQHSTNTTERARPAYSYSEKKTRTTKASENPASFLQGDPRFVFMFFSFNRPLCARAVVCRKCSGGWGCSGLAKVTGLVSCLWKTVARTKNAQTSCVKRSRRKAWPTLLDLAVARERTASRVLKRPYFDKNLLCFSLLFNPRFNCL